MNTFTKVYVAASVGETVVFGWRLIPARAVAALRLIEGPDDDTCVRMVRVPISILDSDFDDRVNDFLADHPDYWRPQEGEKFTGEIYDGGVDMSTTNTTTSTTTKIAALVASRQGQATFAKCRKVGEDLIELLDRGHSMNESVEIIARASHVPAEVIVEALLALMTGAGAPPELA